MIDIYKDCCAFSIHCVTEEKMCKINFICCLIVFSSFDVFRKSKYKTFLNRKENRPNDFASVIC